MRLHAQYTQTIFGLTNDSNGRNQFESDKKKKKGKKRKERKERRTREIEREERPSENIGRKVNKTEKDANGILCYIPLYI